jgi:hypothetical protein
MVDLLGVCGILSFLGRFTLFLKLRNDFNFPSPNRGGCKFVYASRKEQRRGTRTNCRTAKGDNKGDTPWLAI